MASEAPEPEDIVLKHAKVVEPEEEQEADLKYLTVKGAEITVSNRQMLEGWINHTVYVQLIGHGVVEAKILEVSDSHTKIIVVKDQTKADRKRSL